MLNKLRLKFVGISLSIFGVLLIVFFTFSFRNATIKIEKTTEEILHQLSSNLGRQVSVYHTKSNYVVSPNFTLFLDSNNKIIPELTVSNPTGYVGNSNKLLQEFVDKIINSGASNGTISIQNTSGLRYLKVTNNDNTRITFLSRVLEESEIDNARAVATSNTMYLMVLLLLTSILLSIWTFKPVKKALDEQQQFLADASHELRTPLTAIQANLDVILASKEKTIEEQSKWLHYIKDEVSRMRSLTNDLLFLAKNDVHKVENHFKRINFSKIVSQSTLTLESLAFESNKFLEENVIENLMVLGDENRLKQLVIILIDNAIKYATPESKIKIGLSKSNNRVILSIINKTHDYVDTSKIFNRFYREDGSRNRQRGGSGLGLSIAKTIVEDHKGRINAKFNNNQLSIVITFTLSRGKN